MSICCRRLRLVVVWWWRGSLPLPVLHGWRSCRAAHCVALPATAFSAPRWPSRAAPCPAHSTATLSATAVSRPGLLRLHSPPGRPCPHSVTCAPKADSSIHSSSLLERITCGQRGLKVVGSGLTTAELEDHSSPPPPLNPASSSSICSPVRSHSCLQLYHQSPPVTGQRSGTGPWMCLLQGRGDFVLPGANRAWAIASSEHKPLIKVGAGQQAQQAGTLCHKLLVPNGDSP